MMCLACHGLNLELTYFSIVLTTTCSCRLLQQVPCCKETDKSDGGTRDKSSQDNIFRIWGTSNGVHRSGNLVRVPRIQTICPAVPATVYTDQGTLFLSQEFKQFALQYRFEVQHSSPRYPQSNGFIEAMVKVVKGIMEKAEESGSDPHLATLIYHATPIRPGQLSPGEMLSQRKYRALLPIHQYLHPNLEISRDQQGGANSTDTSPTCDYDRTAKKLKIYNNFSVSGSS